MKINYTLQLLFKGISRCCWCNLWIYKPDFQNIKAAKIGAPQGTILKGAPIAQGRSAWPLNNTPKTTAVGITPVKTTTLNWRYRFCGR